MGKWHAQQRCEQLFPLSDCVPSHDWQLSECYDSLQQRSSQCYGSLQQRSFTKNWRLPLALAVAVISIGVLLSIVFLAIRKTTVGASEGAPKKLIHASMPKKKHIAAGPRHHEHGRFSDPTTSTSNRRETGTQERIIGISRSLGRRHHVEWLVQTAFVRVRSQPNFSAKQIGCKGNGSIVFGERHGKWLQLTPERGWMLIEINGHVLLHNRTVNYFQVENGGCAQIGRFPVIDHFACMRAAETLGHGFSSVNLYTGAHLHQEGCYAQYGVVWFVPTSISCRLDNCTQDAQRQPWQPICSSGQYPQWSSSDGFLSTADVKESLVRKDEFARLQQQQQQQQQQPPLKCNVLWPATINDFVRAGYGAAIGFFQRFRAYANFSHCRFVVSTNFAVNWMETGLAPFWSEELSDGNFQDSWVSAPLCSSMSWTSNLKPTMVKCMMSPSYLSDAKLMAFIRSHAWPAGSLYLQTIGPRLLTYRQPYDHAYVAIHMRHGDKQLEMASLDQKKRFQASNYLVGLLHFVQETWPHLHNIFIATDDSTVVREASAMATDSLKITFTSNAYRSPGGAPNSQNGNHVNTHTAVAGVLDDQAALALSSVIIGGSDSNFFNVAKALNHAIHRGMPRPRPWCWDAYAQRFCDNDFSNVRV
mmetsp:Transcript_59320/g.117552  ORF Transcript_59320/g.117552 Transcript_59320/m.117552 type:complete len:644 (-) Transcript_59320:48-1979(-)